MDWVECDRASSSAARPSPKSFATAGEMLCEFEPVCGLVVERLTLGEWSQGYPASPRAAYPPEEPSDSGQGEDSDVEEQAMKEADDEGAAAEETEDSKLREHPDHPAWLEDLEDAKFDIPIIPPGWRLQPRCVEVWERKIPDLQAKAARGVLLGIGLLVVFVLCIFLGAFHKEQLPSSLDRMTALSTVTGNRLDLPPFSRGLVLSMLFGYEKSQRGKYPEVGPPNNPRVTWVGKKCSSTSQGYKEDLDAHAQSNGVQENGVSKSPGKRFSLVKGATPGTFHIEPITMTEELPPMRPSVPSPRGSNGHAERAAPPQRLGNSSSLASLPRAPEGPQTPAPASYDPNMSDLYAQYVQETGSAPAGALPRPPPASSPANGMLGQLPPAPGASLPGGPGEEEDPPFAVYRRPSSPLPSPHGNGGAPSALVASLPDPPRPDLARWPSASPKPPSTSSSFTPSTGFGTPGANGRRFSQGMMTPSPPPTPDTGGMGCQGGRGSRGSEGGVTPLDGNSKNRVVRTLALRRIFIWFAFTSTLLRVVHSSLLLSMGVRNEKIWSLEIVLYFGQLWLGTALTPRKWLPQLGPDLAEVGELNLCGRILPCLPSLPRFRLLAFSVLLADLAGGIWGMEAEVVENIPTNCVGWVVLPLRCYCALLALLLGEELEKLRSRVIPVFTVEEGQGGGGAGKQGTAAMDGVDLSLGEEHQFLGPEHQFRSPPVSPQRSSMTPATPSTTNSLLKALPPLVLQAEFRGPWDDGSGPAKQVEIEAAEVARRTGPPGEGKGKTGCCGKRQGSGGNDEEGRWLCSPKRVLSVGFLVAIVITITSVFSKGLDQDSGEHGLGKLGDLPGRFRRGPEAFAPPTCQTAMPNTTIIGAVSSSLKKQTQSGASQIFTGCLPSEEVATREEGLDYDDGDPTFSVSSRSSGEGPAGGRDSSKDRRERDRFRFSGFLGSADECCRACESARACQGWIHNQKGDMRCTLLRFLVQPGEGPSGSDVCASDPGHPDCWCYTAQWGTTFGFRPMASPLVMRAGTPSVSEFSGHSMQRAIEIQTRNLYTTTTPPPEALRTDVVATISRSTQR